MNAPAEAVEPAVGGVGKKALCERLGWSRMRLDRRLEGDPLFPVVSRGTQAGGWDFDPDAVLAYLGASVDEPEDGEAAGPVRIQHAVEETARSRLNQAQAQLAEDKLRERRGDLVEVGPLKMVLADAMTRLGQGLNSLPDTLVRRLNLPESAGPVIRQEVDQLRRQMHATLRDLLTDG